MNERIEEFYSQVGLDFENFQRVTVKKGDMKKFAELIIRECMFAVENHGGMCGVTSSKKIREHFGVEE